MNATDLNNKLRDLMEGLTVKASPVVLECAAQPAPMRAETPVISGPASTGTLQSVHRLAPAAVPLLVTAAAPSCHTVP